MKTKKMEKTIVSMFHSTKGGVGKTSHSLAKTFGLIEHYRKTGEQKVIVLLSCDENMSFKYFFNEDQDEIESYDNKNYTKLDNFDLPENVLLFLDWVDFENKTFEDENAVNYEMNKNLINENGVVLYNSNNDLFKIDHLIFDLPARHNNKKYNADFMNIVHQANDYISLKSGLNRLEELIKNEKESNQNNKTKFRFILNNTATKPVSKKEVDFVEGKIKLIEERTGYDISLIESKFFNFEFYLKNCINFMAPVESINKSKDLVFDNGQSINRSRKIKTGSEVLSNIVQEMIKDMV